MGIFQKEKKRKNYFNYVGEMSDDVRAEIDRVFRMAVQIFQISDPTDGKTIAGETYRIVDDILRTGSSPPNIPIWKMWLLPWVCCLVRLCVVGMAGPGKCSEIIRAVQCSAWFHRKKISAMHPCRIF